MYQSIVIKHLQLDFLRESIQRQQGKSFVKRRSYIKSHQNYYLNH